MSKRKKSAAPFIDGKKTSKKEATKPSLDAVPGEPSAPSPDQMMQMMQTLQGMLGGIVSGAGQSYASAQPFSPQTPEAVTHEVVLPSTLERGIVVQEALDIHPLYNKLFLDFDGNLLGGVPKGCTITVTGPPYIGKTRSALEMMVRALEGGMKVGYVVAEEGFYDENESGRNDLFSRFLELACQVSGLSEKDFRKSYDDQYVIIPNQYHLGKTWSDFIRDYRYAVEELGIRLMIIDSINMLDPSKINTVENLNALKTYNHSEGVTAIVIGQIKDTGLPQGGEALFHTSEVAIHFFTHSIGSNAEADAWGGAAAGVAYRDKIDLVNARSKVCKGLPFPIRVEMDERTGLLRPHPRQMQNELLPDGFWDMEMKKPPAPKKAAAKKSATKKAAVKKSTKKKSK